MPIPIPRPDRDPIPLVLPNSAPRPAVAPLSSPFQPCAWVPRHLLPL
ncbi:MAG TPA: hypothetical protein VLJ19_07775 [Variovorax sp.]|nr:hypothetical protein [Variovorax sp.]